MSKRPGSRGAGSTGKLAIELASPATVFAATVEEWGFGIARRAEEGEASPFLVKNNLYWVNEENIGGVSCGSGRCTVDLNHVAVSPGAQCFRAVTFLCSLASTGEPVRLASYRKCFLAVTSELAKQSFPDATKQLPLPSKARS